MALIQLQVMLDAQFYAAIAALKTSVDKLTAATAAGFQRMETIMVDATTAMNDLTAAVQEISTNVASASAELKTLADQIVGAVKVGADPAQVEALAQQISTQAAALAAATKAAADEVTPPPGP